MQRKRRKKKRFGVFLFLLVVCIGIGIMFVPWAMQPENFREVKNKINGFLYKEDFPDSYNAKSLILVDCSDDEIFVSKNENEPQIPASLAKLFVIEYASTLADLDSIVVADYGAISLTKPGSSVAQIKEKEYFLHKPHINLLGRVTDQVFSESEEWDIDTVSETIASEYERATNLSINKEKQNLPIEEKRTIDVKEIREWLNFIITIISVVLGVTNSSATTINNYNYTQQVNNYYIVGMGYDAKELNTTKYRIVNRESIVRLKHDCHSIVIEKLEEGKVVRIIDKYKKWRQIIWENEDGEECMGWIQNYKLTEFKVPRNK